MQFTATKSLVRSYFYREFLPSHLTAEQLGRAEFLVLLGDDDLERLELDELDIPGEHIHSVENNQAVFSRQLQRNRNNDSPVNLYFRDLDSLICDYLHSNRRLQVLNLDICGSYLTGIDPVMTKILRFARRNPRTVIATYTNVGRDRDQLREGLMSLAICYWFAPAATKQAVVRLFNRYTAAKLSQDVSMNMVLRHFFWVRSHMEHVMLSGVTSALLRSEEASAFIVAEHGCWKRVVEAVTTPLTYSKLLEVMDELSLDVPPSAKVFNLGIQKVVPVTYASANGFSHTGWFTVYNHLKPPTSAAKWLESALEALTAHPLLFASHGATRLSRLDQTSGLQPGKQLVWRGKGLDKKLRKVAIPPTSIGLLALDRELASNESEASPEPATSASHSQRLLIRELALQGYNTDEVLQRLPDPKPPRASVTAYIANAKRNRSGSQA